MYLKIMDTQNKVYTFYRETFVGSFNEVLKRLQSIQKYAEDYCDKYGFDKDSISVTGPFDSDSGTPDSQYFIEASKLSENSAKKELSNIELKKRKDLCEQILQL